MERRRRRRTAAPDRDLPALRRRLRADQRDIRALVALSARIARSVNVPFKVCPHCGWPSKPRYGFADDPLGTHHG
jgi:hypothetical protein